MRTLLIAAALAVLAASAQAQEPDDCVDAIVVARLIRETPGPMPPRPTDPNLIVMHMPWIMELETEQIVMGHAESRFSATLTKHSEFNPRIDHFLLFLHRDPGGEFTAVNALVYILRDRQGRFVIPLERPLEDYSLWPNGGWASENYESYLRPISYRASDVWWPTELDEYDLPANPPGWWVKRAGHVVALRGLYMDDLARMMAQEPGAICRR
jgi:hypothetical protein